MCQSPPSYSHVTTWHLPTHPTPQAVAHHEARVQSAGQILRQLQDDFCSALTTDHTQGMEGSHSHHHLDDDPATVDASVTIPIAGVIACCVLVALRRLWVRWFRMSSVPHVTLD